MGILILSPYDESELFFYFNNLFAEFIHMRSGKDREYYFVTIESNEELEKLKELTLKKIRVRNAGS